jgi:hypothetical protein
MTMEQCPGERGETHVCLPVAVGPRAGIRCLLCNIPIEPDPRVGSRPSINTEATTAAINARGARCNRCRHWTFRPARPVGSGIAQLPAFCANCTDLGTGSPRVVSVQRADNMLVQGRTDTREAQHLIQFSKAFPGYCSDGTCGHCGACELRKEGF